MTKAKKYLQIEKFVQCSSCRGVLKRGKGGMVCTKCRHFFPLLAGEIPDMVIDVSPETEISLQKWDQLYRNKKYLRDIENGYRKNFLQHTLSQLKEVIPGNKRKGIFLELGSGTAFVGEQFAKDSWFFIGIDFSANALLYLKKRLDKHGLKNYLLIRGDIQNMPLRNNQIDVIFGGGVIEHFENTAPVVSHLYRILKKGGVVLNTVPVLNIGNLIYRSQWGGIPNFPVLKQIAEFIHIKILKSKHMIFGYELQFTPNQLRRLHQQAGFSHSKIFVSTYHCVIELNRIKNQWLRKVLINIIENSPSFWPAVKAVAYK